MHICKKSSLKNSLGFIACKIKMLYVLGGLDTGKKSLSKLAQTNW